MTTNNNAPDGPTAEPDHTPAELLEAPAVADRLGCSVQSVYRLSETGMMPRPVKLGALVRWSRQAIDDWISGGCKPCRRIKSGHGP
jgi:predicted DNA-binding transcriptional regulator AlpA